MDPEIQKRFEEFDERLRQAERRILATGNLVSKAGIPMLVDTQMRLDALTDSETRLYGTVQELARAHAELTQSQRELAESQKRTDAQLNRLAGMQLETERKLQIFIESLSKGVNGTKS